MKITSNQPRYFFLISCFLITLIGQAQTLESKVDALLTAKYKANEPGATALITKNNEVIYRKAFGKANLELDVAMKPEHVFEIGSITKQFTAISILMLEILLRKQYLISKAVNVFIPKKICRNIYGHQRTNFYAERNTSRRTYFALCS